MALTNVNTVECKSQACILRVAILKNPKNMNLNKSPRIFKGLRHPCLGIAAGGDLILGNRQQLIHHIDDHDDFLLTELSSKARHGGGFFLIYISLIDLFVCLFDLVEVLAVVLNAPK